MTDHVITAVFHEPEDAARAVDALCEADVPQEAINVLATEDAAKRAFQYERGGEDDTMNHEGWAFGGGREGPNAVLAAGFSSAGMMPTGGAALVHNGPLVAHFGGAGSGSPPGGMAGGLMGLGIAEEDVAAHERALREGAILLAVDTSDTTATTVHKVLSDNNADLISGA